MNAALVDAVLALAESCARCDAVPSVEQARGIARNIALRHQLAAHDCEAMLELAASYARTVNTRLAQEETRALDGLLIASALDVQSSSSAPELNRRLLPPQWRSRDDQPRRARPRGRANKHRILVVTANVYQVDPVAFSEKYAVIHAQLRAARHGDDFAIIPLLSFGLDALAQHLIASDPAVLHITGRGISDTSLMFQSAGWRPEPISTPALAALISDAAPNLRLIVLDSCSDQTQAECLSTHVDCVVALDGRLPDGDAHELLGQLYRGLGSALSVGEATTRGVAAIASARLPEQLLPRCLTRRGVDASQVIFRPLRGSVRTHGRRSNVPGAPGL